MFGHRSDGKRVKGIGVIDKAMPFFMPQRIDAVNLFEHSVSAENLDKFILKERQENKIHYTYTEVLIAACVRMIYQRPKCNWFISNGMFFKRNYISVSMSVKKSLTDAGEEVTIKMFFTGRENLEDVKRIFEAEVAKSLQPEDNNSTFKLVSALGKFPSWVFKWAVNFLRWADKHGMLPQSLLKNVSPFHTSIYVADLRSIKLDPVYHHLYNFGTTTMFGCLGKVRYVPVADKEGNVGVQKQLFIKYSLDERVCDGLYYGNSLKLLNGFLENPELLKERLPEPELSAKELKQKQKEDKKAAKKAAKTERKAERKAKKKAA